jgi:hypothetical protein
LEVLLLRLHKELLVALVQAQVPQPTQTLDMLQELVQDQQLLAQLEQAQQALPQLMQTLMHSQDKVLEQALLQEQLHLLLTMDKVQLEEVPVMVKLQARAPQSHMLQLVQELLPCQEIQIKAHQLISMLEPQLLLQMLT